MRRGIVTVALVVWTGFTTVLAEGPFGLRMGVSRTEIESMTSRPLVETCEAKFLYSTDRLPRQSKRFPDYRMLIAPGVGLCQIQAVSRIIPTDLMGRALMERFDEMSGILGDLYGPFQRRDELAEGSRWTQPIEWMTGLTARERLLVAEWSRDHGSRLGEQIESIRLRAGARALDEGLLVLEYSFRNLQDCREVVRVAEREVF